jgi:outer membrane protein OmpA-like peptidoglycan-associated protein
MSRRFLGLAAATSLQALLLGGVADAQTVQMFEEPPPLELLRSIMITPSREGGASRRIVMGAPAGEAPRPVAPVAAMPDPVPTQQMPRWRPAQLEQGPPTAAARMAAPATDAPPMVSAVPPPVRVTPAAQRAVAPAPAPQAPTTVASIGFRINFALNSDVIPASGLPFVERIGELMRDQPDLRLQVEGHTDALGSDAYNMDLSRRRAMAVATWLVERQGIEAERLVVAGFGKTQPLLDNPFDGRNRRVQFTRVD